MRRAPFRVVDAAAYARWWRERFDPPGDPFAGMRFYQRGRVNIWVGTADIERLECARLEAVGIHVLRIGRRLWKPTSAAIIAFARLARVNAVDLQRAEAVRFLAGRDVALDAGDPRRAGLSRGFVAARYHGVALGCGEWHERGILASLVPKGQRREQIDL